MCKNKIDLMSSDTKNLITDAFKMKKRLSNCLSIKIGTTIATHSLTEDRSDQVPVPSTSLKRGVKTSPAYLRHKKSRLSQNQNDQGVASARTPKAARTGSDLRRSPRGFSQRTPNGQKTCLSSQESPQEISWEGQSPRFRQQFKSGFKQGIPGSTKNVTEIINVLKSDKVCQAETQENPLTEMWLLSKTSTRQCTGRPAADASRRTVANKPVKKFRRAREELVQLMKTTKDACTSAPCAENSAPPDVEQPPTNTSEDDDLWDDDSFFNDDSFIRQTQITEDVYFSQQVDDDKKAKLPLPLRNCTLTDERKSVPAPAKGASCGSPRFTFRSSLSKHKNRDLKAPISQVTSLPVASNSANQRLTPEIIGESEVPDSRRSFRNVPLSTPCTSEILCPETPTSCVSSQNLSLSSPLSSVSATPLSNSRNKYNFTKTTYKNKTNVDSVIKETQVKMDDPKCFQVNSFYRKASSNDKLKFCGSTEDARRGMTQQQANSDGEHLRKDSKREAVIDEDMSSLLDDDFFAGPDVLELVEAAENTYQALSQPASQPSSQPLSQHGSQPNSQMQCTQEEILKKREAALQRRRDKARLRKV